jgi:hypothetical protein
MLKHLSREHKEGVGLLWKSLGGSSSTSLLSVKSSNLVLEIHHTRNVQKEIRTDGKLNDLGKITAIYQFGFAVGIFKFSCVSN